MLFFVLLLWNLGAKTVEGVALKTDISHFCQGNTEASASFEEEGVVDYGHTYDTLLIFLTGN